MKVRRIAPLIGFAYVAAIACEIRPADGYVIQGPAVPSPVPTRPPYIWDTRDELDVWTANTVSRGSFALLDENNRAFIRITRVDQEWVLRGPDLDPPVDAIRTIRLRYRWEPDPGLGVAASRIVWITAYFERDPAETSQPMATIQLEPSPDWREVDLTQGNYAGTLRTRYFYLHSYGANRGRFDIDRIEAVQQ